jgi:hypothetical protein
VKVTITFFALLRMVFWAWCLFWVRCFIRAIHWDVNIGLWLTGKALALGNSLAKRIVVIAAGTVD